MGEWEWLLYVEPVYVVRDRELEKEELHRPPRSLAGMVTTLQYTHTLQITICVDGKCHEYAHVDFQSIPTMLSWKHLEFPLCS